LESLDPLTQLISHRLQLSRPLGTRLHVVVIRVTATLPIQALLNDPVKLLLRRRSLKTLLLRHLLDLLPRHSGVLSVFGHAEHTPPVYAPSGIQSGPRITERVAVRENRKTMSEKPLGLHLQKLFRARTIQLARLVMTFRCAACGPLILAHLGAADLPEHRLRTTTTIIVRPEINSAPPVHVTTRNQHVAKIARLIAAPDTLPPPRRGVLDRIVHRSVPVRVSNRPVRAAHDLLERRVPRELLNSRGNSPRRENPPACRRGR